MSQTNPASLFFLLIPTAIVLGNSWYVFSGRAARRLPHPESRETQLQVSIYFLVTVDFSIGLAARMLSEWQTPSGFASACYQISNVCLFIFFGLFACLLMVTLTNQ